MPPVKSLVTDNGKLTTIRVQDVIQFAADDKYIEVHWYDNARKEVRMKPVVNTLKRLEKEHTEFIRINRSTLVRKVDIVSIVNVPNSTTGEATLTSKLSKETTTINVSRRTKTAIRRLLAERDAAN